MTSPDACQALTHPITLPFLRKLKAQRQKFSCVALYDAPLARLAEATGVETLLVGDSLGMTVLGFDSTLPVTMEHMLYHVEAVARGAKKPLILGDMPFMSYATPEQALHNAARIMQAGAHVVKLEGGTWLAPTVRLLTERGIPVCAHLGLTPQSVNKIGGYKVQGRDAESAKRLQEDAVALAAAGADLLVLECVPQALAQQITQALAIPTIGIGAGPDTDAQVLVVNDILGLTPKPPSFSKNFLIDAPDIPGALAAYVTAVKSGAFPDARHSF